MSKWLCAWCPPARCALAAPPTRRTIPPRPHHRRHRRGRRRHRRGGARARAEAHRDVGSADHHREQRRRRAHHRRIGGGQCGAGRPHADGGGGRDVRHQSRPLSQGQDSVRSGQGLRPDHRAGPHPSRDGHRRRRSRRNSVADVDRDGEGQAGQITYGTAGVGSGPHVNIARLQNVAGIQMVPVHYRGATPSLNDVMGGHTNMMLISVSSALPNFRAGQVKMIGIGSPQAAAVGVRRADHRRRRQFAGLHRRDMVRHGDDRRHAAGRREENPCRGGEDRRRAGVPRALPGQAIVRADDQLDRRSSRLTSRASCRTGPR